MAPSLSKLKEYKSSLICLSGLSVAAWIIIYGKSSNKKRLVSKMHFDTIEKIKTILSSQSPSRKRQLTKTLSSPKCMNDLLFLRINGMNGTL